MPNGVCLCRAHHGWVHDTHREIILHNGMYYLIEPDHTTRTPLPSKSKIMQVV
jgi:hypothetical protein